MARKFQIGDTVQVVKDLLGNSLDIDFKIGHRGIVVEYNYNYYPQCYRIRRKINKHSLWFSIKELKLIRKK